MSAGTLEGFEEHVAGRFAGRLAERVQGSNLPRAAQVVSWLDLVDFCRALDDTLLMSELASRESLALHEAVLALAIGCGSWLIHQIQANAADISASGQRMETLEASLELLRVLHRSRHSQFSETEIQAARQHIFGGTA